ncbi:tetratricopeptide repeat protein (macronuclear) [Tetrahymena thermophila SB210]|uniref:Tetratricopeptide repeat protein n=1 Tax=Tetrahymena thermophila (strain SB210) TaxID=312017 RepID=Q22V90_TETTS|nr:tetratricopeptide repeat protein [Tetrahymena thermophila SB210]EAR89195.1 tetratricopeptide repeat protein [Tetrahymena thermophila SB210]|eukprot:XP_001009440.1 tetratricopeptide repeat protein [Tetrahymena thermophila SB210]
MNPFSNPHMFEQMKKNMTPEMMQNASQQMNNMSDDDLRRLGQQSGMNISPEMMRMASSMFSGMDESQKKNMMNMAQNMDQNQFSQAQQQFKKQQPTTAQPSSSSRPEPKKNQSTPSPPVDNSLYPQINQLKNKGNEKFKQQNYDEAAQFYLEAIISIDEERMKKLNTMQEMELKEIEINCRNNYCSVKAKQNDYLNMLTQAQAVLKLDPNNIKAKFRLGQSYYGLKKYERALELLTEAKNQSPSDSVILDIYTKCKSEVDKIKKEAEDKLQQENKSKQEDAPKQNNESELKNKQEKQQKKETKVQNVVKEEEIEEKKTNNKEEVIIEEVKEDKKVEQSPNPSSTYFNPKNIDVETIKKQQEMMKNMDDSQLDSMAKMIQNMDNETIRQMYKAQGMDLSDEQIKMIKSSTNKEALKMATQAQPEELQKKNQEAIRHAQANQQFNLSQHANPETIKKSQEQLKNMDESQINSMANMVKNMDNAALKSMYKMQGMDLTDEQINMMKNMMTPDMIKAASSMDPSQILKQGQGPATFPTQPTQSTSSNVSSTGSTEPQPQVSANAQQMPDMSNMGSILENSQMLDTALNMLISNPEMLKMMTAQMPNHPFANYLNNASPQDLQRLAKIIKNIIPAIKYIYKGYKLVVRFKKPLLILIVALIIRYFLF